MQIARIYLQMISDIQSIENRLFLIKYIEELNLYIASIYEEEACGISSVRPQMQKMISEIQHGEYIIAEQLDLITKLPISQAEELIMTIRNKGAFLLLPELAHLSKLVELVPFNYIMNFTQDILFAVFLQASYNNWLTCKEKIN